MSILDPLWRVRIQSTSQSGKSAFRWRSFEKCTDPQFDVAKHLAELLLIYGGGIEIKEQEAEFGAREGGLESVLKGKNYDYII